MRQNVRVNLATVVSLLYGLLIGADAGDRLAADSVPCGVQTIRVPEDKRSPFVCAVYSPDGASFLSGHSRKRICLWDAVSGKVRKEIEAPDECVTVVAFAPDGAAFASGGMGGGIDVWDTVTGQRQRTFSGQQGFVSALSFSPDGKLVASGGEDRFVRVWEVGSGRLLAKWSGHESDVTFVGFAVGGEEVVSGSADGTICFRNAKTGKEMIRLKGMSPTLSANGRVMAYATCAEKKGQWSLHLRDVAGQKQLQEIGRAGTTIRVLAFSPDGKVLAAFGRVSTSPNEVLETIGLWEVCTGSLIRRLKYDRVPSLVPTLSFSPDGRHLLCCGFSEQAFLWDLSCWPAAVQGEHGRRSFAALWRELSGNDTPLAHQAMWQCVANPKETVEAFTGRLLPAAEVSAKTLASLIDQLDSDDFTAREKATRTLAELGNSAEGALREAAKSPSSAEAARRIEKLLALLEGKSPSEARALAALEQIGTPEAKKLLERLAKGAPDACLTREAKESLARLLKRRGQGRNGRSPTEERKETKE